MWHLSLSIALRGFASLTPTWIDETCDSIGSSVILSRTDPLVDRVRVNGTLGPEGRPLRGQVYSATRSYVRVEFDDEVHMIAEGTWRLGFLARA